MINIINVCPEDICPDSVPAIPRPEMVNNRGTTNKHININHTIPSGPRACCLLHRNVAGTDHVCHRNSRRNPDTGYSSLHQPTAACSSVQQPTPVYSSVQQRATAYRSLQQRTAAYSNVHECTSRRSLMIIATIMTIMVTIIPTIMAIPVDH